MVRRTRLTDLMASEPRANWLIEAGAGYGKSALVNELRGVLPGPLVLVRRTVDRQDLAALSGELTEAARRVRVPELSAILAEDNSPERVATALVAAGCSVAVDDVHEWDDRVGTFLLAVAAAMESSGSTMLLVGRGLPNPLATIRDDPSWGFIGTSDLALQVDEVAEVLRSQGSDDSEVATSVHRLTSGWPVAVAAVCARLRSNPQAVTVELTRFDGLIDGLVHGYFDDVNDEDLAASQTLALLPFFDDQIAEIVGSDGLIDRLAAAGAPVTRQADGWTELPEQFRASLLRMPRAARTTSFDPRIMNHFVHRGEIQAAITSCLAVGDGHSAAEIIGGASYAQESQLDPVALNAAMTTIGEIAHQVPRSLLVQAQVNVSHGAFDEGLRCIERAEAAVDAAGQDVDDPVHQEILLELGVWRHFSGRQSEARELMERCQVALSNPPANPTRDFEANHARLLDLQGLLSMHNETKESLDEARLSMTEALAIWRRLQEPRAAAATALRLVSDVLTDLGRRHEAIALLDNLPSVGPMTLVNQARIQLQRARVLPYLGRGAEVDEVLAESRRIANLVGQDWLLAMAASHEAVAASFVYDRERVEALCDELDAHPERFVTGADEGHAWCLVADALTRCGSYERAATVLQKAQGCEGVHRPTSDFSRAALEAHAGDPSKAARMLDELAAQSAIPERRWVIALLQGLCALRNGDRDGTDKYLQASFDEATALGQRALPLIAERRIVDQLQNAEQPQPVSPLAETIEVSLFNEFAVSVNGQPVNLPGGQVSDLVKLLVLSNGRLVVEQVIDQLWPDVDLSRGRPRLRNVHKRLRKVADQLVVRSGEVLVLGSQVNSDYARAVAAAEESAHGQASLSAVTEAVRLNSRTLLSDDLYADWAEEARTAQRIRLVKLLDRQADLAERAGDIDLAVAALETAHEADGTSEARVRHACSLLASAGREGAADALAGRHLGGAELG